MAASSPADWAPLIVAVATFVTALAGAIAVVYNARRANAKLDAAEVVRTQIHKAVNGDRDRDRALIASLQAEVASLRAPPISDH